MTPEHVERRWLSVAQLDAVFLLEFVYATACIDKLLFTCVERVASRTDLYFKIRFDRTCFESVSACARCRNHIVLRMNGWFQRVHLLSALDHMRIQSDRHMMGL